MNAKNSRNKLIYKMNFYFLLLLLLIATQDFWAQQYEDPIVAGMGNASVGSVNCWSALNNPANIALQKNSTVATAYSDRYSIPELAERKVIVNQLLNRGATAVYFTDFGYELYQLRTVGLVYGIALSKEVYGGASLRLNRLKLGEQYGKLHQLTANVGFTSQINKQFRISSSVVSLNNTKGRKSINNGIRKRLAFAYSFSESVDMQIELDKHPTSPLQIKWGIAYQLDQHFTFRTGIQETRQQFGFGLSYSFYRFRIHLAFAFQAVLGYQPAVSLAYVPSKN